MAGRFGHPGPMVRDPGVRGMPCTKIGAVPGGARDVTTTAAASDPFESTANPARYVARPACEEVLGAIEFALLHGSEPVVLTGPTGLGKTMLLQVLGERLAQNYRVVRLPYPALSAAEICRWVLDGLGEPVSLAGDDPEGALLDRAFREAGAGREILLYRSVEETGNGDLGGMVGMG